LNIKALIKPLLVYLLLLTLFGCGIPGSFQNKAVNIEMFSSTELKDGQLTHGCIVKASRGKRQFEQTVNFERSELGLSIQHSKSYISVDPDTHQVRLSIGCTAGHPHMLENTTVKLNVFDWMGISAKLDIEKRFDSKIDRDQYLRELVQAGFKVSVSAWNSPYFDDTQIPTNNPQFQAGELSGIFHVPYDLLGIWRQPSPNCSGGFFHAREFTISIPPQNPEDYTSYRYIDPTLLKLNKEVIYIPEWYASGVIDGYIC